MLLALKWQQVREVARWNTLGLNLTLVKMACPSSKWASEWEQNLIEVSLNVMNMVIGGSRAGLSISQTAHLARFLHTSISRVVREWSQNEKISSEQHLCAAKCLVDVRGQRSEWAGWPEKGNSNSNSHWLQPRSAKQHLWTHNTFNLEADRNTLNQFIFVKKGFCTDMNVIIGWIYLGLIYCDINPFQSSVEDQNLIFKVDAKLCETSLLSLKKPKHKTTEPKLKLSHIVRPYTGRVWNSAPHQWVLKRFPLPGPFSSPEGPVRQCCIKLVKMVLLARAF